MARTVADTDAHVPADLAPAATTNGISASAVAARPKNGCRFTDADGKVAYLWWERTGPVVESTDTALRRRVLRALKQPIWAIEDEPDEFGVQWSTRRRYQPDDPRYALHWFWSLGQVGLEDVEAEIVRRQDRRAVWTPAQGHIRD
ncbi:MAG: hypothetical protein HY332_06005 [Chloroflexi bacterium]|nr:hypothetical protein [Chloroflexota bacterium]